MTREIRWFLPEPVPELELWFREQGLPLEAQPGRTDRYLVLDHSRELGLKFREGNLEPKKRLWGPEPGQVGPKAEGFFEGWGKWSFSLAPSTEEIQLEQAHWVEVRKSRSVCFAVKRGESYHFSKDANETDDTCQLEYSRLQLAEETWYGFCLEWPSGATISMDEWLTNTLADTRLTSGESMSYPEFLLNRQ